MAYTLKIALIGNTDEFEPFYMQHIHFKHQCFFHIHFDRGKKGQKVLHLVKSRCRYVLTVLDLVKENRLVFTIKLRLYNYRTCSTFIKNKCRLTTLQNPLILPLDAGHQNSIYFFSCSWPIRLTERASKECVLERETWRTEDEWDSRGIRLRQNKLTCLF